MPSLTQLYGRFSKTGSIPTKICHDFLWGSLQKPTKTSSCLLSKTVRYKNKLLPEVIDARFPLLSTGGTNTYSFQQVEEACGPFGVAKSFLAPALLSLVDGPQRYRASCFRVGKPNGKHPHLAVAQKNATHNGANPGKWKHGPKPAVCPSGLVLSHAHLEHGDPYRTHPDFPQRKLI